jgi:hypothetical protein
LDCGSTEKQADKGGEEPVRGSARGEVVNQELNVLALIKGDERYVYVYDDASRARLVDRVHAQAANAELSLNWFDAAVLTQKAEEQAAQATGNKKAHPRFLDAEEE